MLLSDFLQNVNFIVTYLRKIAVHVQILMQLDFLEIKSKKYASINNNNCLSALFSADLVQFYHCAAVENIFAQKKKNILEKGNKDPKIGLTEASSQSYCVRANRSQQT